MAQRMIVQSLSRLTLVRKGRATAKHPDMREGVVEAIKASDEVLDTPSDTIDDWYSTFDTFVATTQFGADDDILQLFSEYHKESAKGKNYPDSQGPFAGPHNSFPIRTAGDVIHAAQRLHNAKGNQAKIKARIVAIAHAHGYPLPKTWGGGKGKTSSVNATEILETIRELLTGGAEETPAEKAEETPETPAVETPAEIPAEIPAETPAEEALAAAEKAEETPAVETPAAEVPDSGTPEAPSDDAEAEKAMQGHSHQHSHSSMRGYEYSHQHQHGDASHPGAADHDTSETAHAHVHVTKAGDNPDVDGLLADVAGLEKDVATARDEIEALKAQVAELTASKEIVALKAARKPLTAAPPQSRDSSTEKPQITSNMSFNDAFAKLMGRTTPLR